MLDGGEIIPSSFLSHLGGLALGVLAVRRLGWAPGAWWMALAGQVAMLLVSRVVTPAERNINLAFRVWEGWEDWFPSYALYFYTLLALSGAGYLALTWIFRQIRVGPQGVDGR
jgi:hypothetical protein